MAQSQHNLETHLRGIQEHSFEFHDMVLRVRSLFLEACPGLTEAVKYGGIVFLKNGGLIGGVFVYKEHVSVEFSQGSSFPDPDAVLEGKGKYRRHIKLHDLEDIDAKHLVGFIVEACG